MAPVPDLNDARTALSIMHSSLYFVRFDRTEMAALAPTAPRLRWRILASAITRSSNNGVPSHDLAKASVRSFESYALLDRRTSGDDAAEYTLEEGRALFLRYRQPTSVQDMIGFNNTGNVCVWPAEEVLAFYAIRHSSEFRGKSVCELGGGMASVAGMSIAACCAPQRMLLTDGNDQSVADIRDFVLVFYNMRAFAFNIESNRRALGDSVVHAGRLVWSVDGGGEDPAWHGSFDIVIAADCIFFTEAHDSLVSTAARLLRPGGRFVSVAPMRGKTLSQFVSAAIQRREFSSVLVARCTGGEWDADVDRAIRCATAGAPANGFVSDLHEPLVVELTRCHSANNR